MNKWSEKLTKNCPPNESFVPDGLILYRICDSNPPTSNDLKSQRANCPKCNFNVPECIARSLSTWNDLGKCQNLLKLPRFKNANPSVMKLKLHPKDGVVLQTFKANHYSWWRTENFDISSIDLI